MVHLVCPPAAWDQGGLREGDQARRDFRLGTCASLVVPGLCLSMDWLSWLPIRADWADRILPAPLLALDARERSAARDGRFGVLGADPDAGDVGVHARVSKSRLEGQVTLSPAGLGLNGCS